MVRFWLGAAALACGATAAYATPKLLDAPQLTIRPQATLPVFTGQTTNVMIGWRPVLGAARYRLAFTNAKKETQTFETTDLRYEAKELAIGTYQVTVAALDSAGTASPPSEVLPLTVLEIHAIPPGAGESMAPQRGAYALGTRFSVAGMHCEFSDAPVDDLLVGPENEARIPIAGIARLRCAGIPGYLEKQVVIAPVTVSAATSVERGTTTDVHVTVASVAYLGDRLDVEAIGDITLGDAQRTDFGFDVPVNVLPGAKTAALSVQTADLELGRASLTLTEAHHEVPPPPPVHVPLDWRALDLGGQAGAFLPPDGGKAPTIGHPTNAADVVAGGPLAGLRLGFFPTTRVGLEVEANLIEAGRGDNEGSSHIFAARLSVAVRALEGGSLGLRLLAGAGSFTNLTSEGSSEVATQAEVHAGAAFTVETSPNLWLRFQFVDAVTTARDDGYAHCLELQLGVMTRVGRHDVW